MAISDDASMAVKAVVFDIGGVLELTPATRWQDRWAASLGMRVTELDARLGPVWAAGEIGAVSYEEVERQVAQTLELDAERLDRLMQDAWSEYLGTLNEDMARYFAALRPRYRTGILSNSFVGAREREQRAYGFADMCDLIVYSHEEGTKKPDPAIYQAVCDRLHVSPQEVVFVDDFEAGVQGARRIGMKAIRFTDTEQAIAELDRLLA
ncbi:MAG: HAD family phosphatase [Solirubrobacteraceae bacterium]